MKKFTFTLTFLLICSLGFAQIRTECGAAIPTTTCPPPQATDLCPDETTVPPTASSGSPFTVPNVEFVITDPNVLADDFDDLGVAQNLGPAIIAVDADGVFTPESLGLPTCQDITVTAVSYNLGQIQTMIDNLFNNTFAFIPCCTLAETAIPDLCTTLMANGINSGSDIQSLTDVFALLEAFGSTGTSSIVGFLNDVDQINIDAASLPGPCGGAQLPICYAADVDDNCTYTNHDIPSIDLVFDNSPVSLDVTASSCEAIEYSVDGSTFQASGIFNGSEIPQSGTVFVRTVSGRCLSTAPYSLDALLPVELLYFKASIQKTVTQLNWATASEINNRFFTIDRSSDGINFEEIARIEGAGNSSQTTKYEFFDQYPLHNISYYRLGNIDDFNNKKYNKTITIKREEAKSFNLIGIRPNPVKDQLNLSFSSALSGEATYQIFDPTGRLMKEGRLETIVGVNNQQIDLSSLNSGLFLLYVNMNEQGYSSRFIKE